MNSISPRSLRAVRLPVVLALSLLALSLIGCSGAGSPPAPAPAPTSVPPTPAAEREPTMPAPTSTPVPPTPTAERERTLIVYSGRSQTLVDPLLESFGAQTGVTVRVKYAGSAATAATLLEEGDKTPADVVFMQDPGSLGILADAGMFAPLPSATLDKVDPRFRSPAGLWVGTSGRARTVVYNTDAINPATDLPPSILDFTKPEWNGRVGWAPRNGSFQAFVTGLRAQLGEDAARAWLVGMRDNGAVEYPKNTPIVAATAAGEVDVGFVNHYYLERFLAEQGPGFGARNYFIGNGDPGALVLVAGVGILSASDNRDVAAEFVDFMLSATAQQYFASEIREYPVAAGIAPAGELPPLESLNPPNVDLGSLSDLEGTLKLLQETGVLP